MNDIKHKVANEKWIEKKKEKRKKKKRVKDEQKIRVGCAEPASIRKAYRVGRKATSFVFEKRTNTNLQFKA